MDVVSYKCPNCAAPLSFDIDGQAWDCKFCGASFLLDQLTGQDAPEQEPANKDSGGQWGEGEADVYDCPSCGGRIITDKNTAATFCVYCHNPTVIASRLRGEDKPQWVIPFQKKRDEAVAAVQKLCKNKPLLPRAFRDSVDKGEVSGLYVPFWLFSSDLSVHLDATAQHIRTWSDGKYNYTKTDTFAVKRAADISVRHIPADGSIKMDDRLMEAMEPYSYGELKGFAMEYMSGHYAETYDVPVDQAEKRVRPRLREGAENLIRGQVKGYSSYQVRGLDVKTRTFGHEYAMLPVWTLMHEYKGKTYYFAMNGQTGKMVGKLPINWARAALIFGGCWLAVFLPLLFAAVLA